MSIIYLESKDNPKIKHLRGLIEQQAFRKRTVKLYLKAHIYVCLGYSNNAKLTAFYH